MKVLSNSILKIHDIIYLLVECPAGYEPRALPMGEKTCAPCKLGYTKELAGGESDFCTVCKKSRWTLITGTTSGCISEFLFCETYNTYTRPYANVKLVLQVIAILVIHSFIFDQNSV